MNSHLPQAISAWLTQTEYLSELLIRSTGSRFRSGCDGRDELLKALEVLAVAEGGVLSLQTHLDHEAQAQDITAQALRRAASVNPT